MLTAPGSSPAPATTLAEALDALVPEPLPFEGDHPNGNVLYAPRPERFEEGLRVRGPEEALRQCYNDKVWYEANPLLWTLLEPYSK